MLGRIASLGKISFVDVLVVGKRWDEISLGETSNSECLVCLASTNSIRRLLILCSLEIFWRIEFQSILLGMWTSYTSLLR
jgi:hypothetical protein